MPDVTTEAAFLSGSPRNLFDVHFDAQFCPPKKGILKRFETRVEAQTSERAMDPEGRTSRDASLDSDDEEENEVYRNAGLLEKHTNENDLEAQRTKRAEISAAEYQVPTSTKYLFLAVYFTLNLALTICNKLVLGKVCQ